MEDFDKICRTCLDEITDFKYLFDFQNHINEEKLRLSEILTACTSIEVLENDNLPKQVCIKCKNKILNAFSFQQLCHKSDSVLRAILTQSDLVQPQLIDLKEIVNADEVSLNSSKQYNNNLSYGSSEKNKVNHLVNTVENVKSYLNESIKDHFASEESNEANDCLMNTGNTLGSDDVHVREPKHTSYSFNENNQENYLSHGHQRVPLSSFENENYLSSSYCTEAADSQHIELKVSSISSRSSFEQEEVNNLDEAVNAQLTSVKILKEENDSDERNFSDQEHIEPAFHSLKKNQENTLLPNNELPKEVEDGTLQSLPPCKAKGCGASSISFQDLKTYRERHLSKHNYCKICNRTFHSSSSLSRHINNIHNPDKKNYLCSECGKTFTRSDDLKNHIQRHTGEKPFKCPKCDTRFYLLRWLVQHMKIHTGLQQKYICEFCNRCFTSSSLLTLHKRIHTGEKPFSCNICGKSFPQSSRLIVHRRTHSGEKPYICTFCGRGSATSSHLKVHMRMHTGERPHPCKSCTETFKRACELKRHTLQVHTDKRDYICHFCHRGFVLKSKLKQHMVVHSDARDHVCNICNKGFKHKGVLQTHLRIHSGERPFTCNVCSRTFTHKSSHWAHMKKHRQKEKPESNEKKISS